MLELVNSLCGAFVVSEIMFHERPIASMRVPIVAVVALNVLLCNQMAFVAEFVLGKSIVVLHDAHQGVYDSLTGMGAFFGTQMLLTFAVSAFLLALIAGVMMKREGRRLNLRVFAAIAVLAVSCSYVLLGMLQIQGWLMHHVEAFKAVLGIAAFTVMCYFDIRRQNPELELGGFFMQLAQATVGLAPMLPFIAIAISTVFFVLVSVLEAVSLSTKWLNMPIYYGTLYGPSVAVYYEVKRKSLGKTTTLLPSFSRGGRRIKGGVLETEKMRAARMATFAT